MALKSNWLKPNTEHLMISGSIYEASRAPGSDQKPYLIDDNSGLPFADSKGVIIPSNASSAVVSTDSVESVQELFGSSHSWRNQHSMSMDGLFMPYTTIMSIDHSDGTKIGAKENSANFEVPYTHVNTEGRTVSVAPFGINAKTATSANLNPFAKGHGIENVIRGQTPVDLSVSRGGYVSNISILGAPVVKETAAQRPIGMRGPMVLTGWGYDTDGLPVPNARMDGEDIETNHLSQNFGKPKNVDARFPTDYDQFTPGHMKSISKWKSGPVDLRWDRDRKVWTAAVNKVFLSKTTKCILPEAGPDGLNSFNFGVGGNVNIGGRLYRNPCSEQPCNWDSYFPRSSLYPDIEVYDPEDQDWCGGCKIVGRGPTGGGGTTVCDDWSQACVPFYDAVIIRSIEHYLGEQNTYTNCGDKFNRAGPDPVKRRAGNPCHGWGGAYGPQLENINRKIAKDSTFTHRAKSILYQKIFIENPLNQGLMIGDSFLSYDTGRRVSYTYIKSNLPTCNTAGVITSTPKPEQVTESIPVHVILQAEFVGVELITRSGCEQGEVTACSRKIFAQGFSTMEDCGPDDDYPQTATGYF